MSQTIGLTEISVEYSSPGVKGRKIWGGLLPYGEIWRAGANAATKVTFSKDVTVAGTPVAAGSYAFLAIPGEREWTLILSKDFNATNSATYKKEMDVARAQVQPKSIPNRERLAYLVSDFNEDAASLDLEWEKVRVSLPIKVDTEKQALANIKNVTDNGWVPYNSAARYMLETKKDYDAGLKLVDTSIALKEDWFNDWTKAQLLEAKGRHKEAYTYAEKARQLGEKTPDRFFAANDVKKAVAEWKGKR
jgi:hypothetical protein